MLVFGKWVKPHFRYSETSIGICLGFVALTIMLYDFEDRVQLYMTKQKKAMEILKRQIAKSKLEVNDLKMKLKGYVFSNN